MEPSVSLKIFPAQKLVYWTFVIALPLGVNMGKTCALSRLQLPHVYKVRGKRDEMVSKFPASDSSL